MKRQEEFEHEYMGRIEKLRKRLEKSDVEISLIVQNVDRFYFTGTIQDGVLLLPREGEPVLFIRRSYERANEECYLKNVVKIRGFKDIHEYILDNNLKHGVIGVEMDTVPVSIFNRLRYFFDKSVFRDISEEIKDLRMIKSDIEQMFLFEAGARIDTVLDELSLSISDSITEYEIHRILTETLVRSGSLQYGRVRAFNMEVISNYVMCGENATRLSFLNSASAGGKGISRAFPAGASFDKIQKGKPLLVDMLYNFEGYFCDCTRIFSIGKPENRFLKAHEQSIRIHEIFKEGVERGFSIKGIWDDAMELVKEENLENNFMPGLGFFGHGIGLELDEKPFIYPENLENILDGSVVALEPKFIFDDGVVGVENTYVIRNGSAVSTTTLDENIWIL